MELSKYYEPAGIESKWYAHWSANHYFNSFPDGRPPFTVVIPPPNVTGVLHMGHTLNETVQCLLGTRQRSCFNCYGSKGSRHAKGKRYRQKQHHQGEVSRICI